MPNPKEVATIIQRQNQDLEKNLLKKALMIISSANTQNILMPIAWERIHIRLKNIKKMPILIEQIMKCPPIFPQTATQSNQQPINLQL